MQKVSSLGQKSKKVAEVLVEFTAKNLTGFAGLVPFVEFARRLGVEAVLDGCGEARQGRRYSQGRMIMAMVLGFVVGLDRLRDVAALRFDRVLLKALGWAHFPVQTTISRFLWAFTESRLAGLAQGMHQLLERFRNGWKGHREIHLDLDSHVRTVHGATLEGAEKGYNPHKRGRLSYHPLLAFIGETRDFLCGRFRPGNTTSNGAVALLLRGLALLRWERFERVTVRADSGFCYLEFIQAVEATPRARYAIALKLYRHHQARFAGIDYRPVGGSSPEEGLEIASYGSTDWSDGKERRTIVIRQKLPDESGPGIPGKQLKLFELQGYAYRAIVTNIQDKSAEEVWREYNGRACCENFIKEGIMMGLDVNATRTFLGNAAHFHIVMLGYNLLNWYKEFAIEPAPPEREQKVGRPLGEKPMRKQICQRLLQVPATLAKSGRRLYLKLSADWPWRQQLETLVGRLLNWQPAWA